MSQTILKTDGTPIPVYRAVGEIVFGTDQDFTDTVAYNLPSFLHAMEELGFAVTPIEDPE